MGQLIGRKLLQHPEYGINLIGFVDAEPKERRADLEHLTLLGPRSRLATIVEVFDVERVLIAFSNASHEEMLELIRSLKDLDVQIDLVPRLFDVVTPSVGIHTVEGLPLIGLRPLRLSHSSRFLKRALDLVGSIAALVVLAPLFAHDGARDQARAQGRSSSGRSGWGGRPPSDLQVPDDVLGRRGAEADTGAPELLRPERRDERMFKAVDDPRVTRVGALRRYSLDEVPTASERLPRRDALVGPRPLILDEDKYVQVGPGAASSSGPG